MISAIVIFISATVAFLHCLVLLRKKLVRELIVFFLLMIPGAVLTFMAANLIIIQEPLKFLEIIYKPVNDLFSWLVS